MSKKRALGKGLEALLPEYGDSQGTRLKEINVNEIMANPGQPRITMDEEKLAELAASIKEHGVVQPIVVRPLEDGKYELIAGERRWRACKKIGLLRVPAVIRDFDELEAAAVSLIENIQRENLNPLEEARAYSLLIEKHGLTQEEISKRVGKSRPFVGNMVRLLALPDEIQKMLLGGEVTPGHARALLSIKGGDKQVKAARIIAAQQMNVRQAEELARKIQAQKAKRVTRKEKGLKELENSLTRYWDWKSRIIRKRKGGFRVALDFDDMDEIREYVNRINR